MKASLIVTGAVLAFGLATGVAQAANSYLIRLDDTGPADTVTGLVYENGSFLGSTTFPTEQVNTTFGLADGAYLLSTFDDQWNYYDPGSTVLSDTVEVSGTAGATFFTIAFASEPFATTPLPNGGFHYENGTWQPAICACGGGYVSNGDYYNVQIRSGVPEPATWAMMLLGLGVVGLAARRRTAAALTA